MPPDPSNASVGYGIAYPFGVVGVVLFVQLVPKLLKTDMAAERARFEAAQNVGDEEFHKTKKEELFYADSMGFFPFALAIALGIILAKIVIPLPGGAEFSLGTSGGPLIAGLILGHFGQVGKDQCAGRETCVWSVFGNLVWLCSLSEPAYRPEQDLSRS